MQLSILILFAVAAAAHIIGPIRQPGYIAPHATGYIYRSDNDGPASLIQLGVPNYQQPHAFAPPIPLAAQPLQDTNPIFALQPAVLPYVAAKPIIIEDAEEDDENDSDESSEEYHDGGDAIGHGHGYEKGAGSDYAEENHAAHGEKGSKAYHSKDHHAAGESGHYDKEHEEGHNSEEEGEKGSHHDEAEADGSHHEAGKGHKGEDHGHKKHFSKGEDVTGYHKVFHKDEFKKDHDFYDVADNSGHFNKHGYQKGHHGSEESSHKKGDKKASGYEKEGFGKAGFHSKGYHDKSDSGHSAKEGNESHYNQEEDYAKKGGSGHEKEFAYDDGDYDEE